MSGSPDSKSNRYDAYRYFLPPGAGAGGAAARRRRGPPGLRRESLVHPRQRLPGRPGAGAGDADPRPAGGVDGPLPRSSCCRTPAGADRHGREHPDGGLLRSAVRPDGRTPGRGQVFEQGPRADALDRRPASGGRSARRGDRGGDRCRHRHGRRECQPSFSRAVRRYSGPAAREPAVGRRPFGRRE